MERFITSKFHTKLITSSNAAAWLFLIISEKGQNREKVPNAPSSALPRKENDDLYDSEFISRDRDRLLYSDDDDYATS